jgi:hypothetical protein
LLAWRGTILIPIGFIFLVFPWVEESYKFDLMKVRLESEIINSTDMSLLVMIKCKLSKIFPSFFGRERVIAAAMERMEDDLDVIHLLQLQTIMRRQRC